MVDRERELRYLIELQHCNIGPAVYGVFGNGRIEEFYDDALVVDPLRGYSKSKQIAIALTQFHRVVPRQNISDLHQREGIWPILVNWYQTARRFTESDFKVTERYRKYVDLDWQHIQREIEWMQQILPSKDIVNGTPNALRVMMYHYGDGIEQQMECDMEMRLELMARRFLYDRVLCHNDVYVGNVLERKTNGEVVLIDFEYTSYNHRGYDLATLFGRCERKAFRESDICDRRERKEFIADYLSQFEEFERGKYSDLEWECLLRKCDCVVLEFCMINAFIWGIWAVNQAVYAKIEGVEYIDYARLRLYSQYEFFKKLWLQHYQQRMWRAVRAKL